MNTVTMYTRTQCGFCNLAKNLLVKLGVTPEVYNIETDPARHAEMERRVPQDRRRTVPQIFIGAHYVGGYSELATLHQQGELKALLGIA